MLDSETYLDIAILRTHDKGFISTLYKDGQPTGSHTCSFGSYQAVHTLVDGLRQLLKSVGNAQLAAPLLHSVGVELFHLWLAPFWSAIDQTVGLDRCSVFLTVVADAPEVLNLPWELLKWPSGVMLGLDSGINLRRRPSRYLDHAVPPPESCPQLTITSAPLKILCMVSAPTGFNNCDAAQEMATFFHAMQPSLENVFFVFNSVSTATREALIKQIQQLKPHIVYLSGPTLIRGEQGFFCFEDERGQADIRSATEIVEEIFVNSGVPMVIIGGRELSAPPPVAAVGALCQAFVFHGIDWALAWPSTPSEPFFKAFMLAFLQNASHAVNVERSIQMARQTIQPDCAAQGYPAWLLPVLYARSCRTLHGITGLSE